MQAAGYEKLVLNYPILIIVVVFVSVYNKNKPEYSPRVVKIWVKILSRVYKSVTFLSDESIDY